MATMTKASNFEIVRVRTDNDVEDWKRLYLAYIAWLDMDLSFQDIDAEMATLPGKYGENKGGALLLARVKNNKQAIGSIALTRFDDTSCEMKRLYVVDSAKGTGCGRALITALLDIAVKMGYQTMKCDSLSPRMDKPIAMYRKFGFEPVPNYNQNPLADSRHFELVLSTKRHEQVSQSTIVDQVLQSDRPPTLSESGLKA